MRNRTLSTEPENPGVWEEADLICARCDEDLTYADETTYSEWTEVGSLKPVFMHLDESCGDPAPMSFFRNCTCCASEFDLADNLFDRDSDENLYCSPGCMIRHTTICVKNVEEPDIVY